MIRVEFLALLSAAVARPALASLDDPALSSAAQELRVLLGSGTAVRVDEESFIFAGRRYRGTFAIVNGRVINRLTIEAYLYSVVPREMPRSWPATALAAQAVVARTYVLQRSDPARDYDLAPTELDQVYTGIDAEHAETSAAVDETAGRVLRYGDAFASTAYSSCCGGRTESNADAWGGTPLPYLGGVVCGYCADSPWYAWVKSVPFVRVESQFAQNLAAIGSLHGVALQSTDASGRARFWLFQGQSGAIAIKAEDVRRGLGTRTLPSLLVRQVSSAQDSLVVQGGGLGHGVGLCQWGARGMALAGASPPQILARYFPGTHVGHV